MGWEMGEDDEWVSIKIFAARGSVVVRGILVAELFQVPGIPFA